MDDVFPKIPNPSTTDYTAFQQAGMYDVYGVFPIGDNDTCSSSSHNNTDWTNVAECTKAITPPQCCYQFPKPTTNASLVSLYCADQIEYGARLCNAMHSMLYCMLQAGIPVSLRPTQCELKATLLSIAMSWPAPTALTFQQSKYAQDFSCLPS